MAAVKASPFLAFYKLVGSGKAEPEEEAPLLDGSSNPSTSYTPDEEATKQAVLLSGDTLEQDVGPKAWWSWYADLLEKHPLLVKAVTAFFILGLGDAAAQGVEALRDASTSSGTTEGFDWIRAVRFGAFGFLGAPWAHYYYFFLDYYFPPTEKPFTSVTALKLFIDQGLQAPALLALIISLLALLKGTGFAGIKSDMQANYMNTLIANWILWLPASLINMAFVKPEYRVLYVNVVFFFWTILLSMLVNTSDTATE